MIATSIIILAQIYTICNIKSYLLIYAKCNTGYAISKVVKKMERQSVDYKKVGSRIKETRQNKGMTREKLSEKVSISTMYLGQLERGERRGGINNFIEIANVLELSLDYLFFNEIYTDKIIENRILEKIDTILQDLDNDKKVMFLNITLDIAKHIKGG